MLFFVASRTTKTLAPGETVTVALMEVEVPVAAGDSESTTVTAPACALNRARSRSTTTIRRPGAKAVKTLAQADAKGIGFNTVQECSSYRA